MKPATITHEAISASAGSGKTYQLANRYIRLLANKVPPDRICALTFSRKAAGEIFEAIVKRLCSAAESADSAKRAAAELETPGMTRDDFVRFLHHLLDNLHRLHVGTLDSFIISIVRAFPAELGIPSGFQVVNDNSSDSNELCRQAFAGLFDPHCVDIKARRDFLEAFKQATFGREEKGSAVHIERFVSQYKSFFHVLPKAQMWGNENVIWPGGNAWLAYSHETPPIAEELEAFSSDSALPAKIQERWRVFIAAARNFGPYSLWPDEIEYMLGKLIPVIGELREGDARLSLERKEYRLSPQQCSVAFRLISHVMSVEIKSALERTRGIYRVLRQHDQLHDALIRRVGQLMFSDAQHLLTSSNQYSGGALISRCPAKEQRLYIDYRLDSRLDHWLLDEFQDTSDLQWAVLSNLADEILQDAGGQRTLFYVGDVKQAIYGWRGGNARLFGKILQRYKGLISERPLNTSFRSCQVIIDTVNKVFGDLNGTGLPEGAISEWNEHWRQHECRIGKVPPDGYVALLEPPHDDGKPTAQDRYNVAASILKEINPLSHGLSTAILVRTNEEGRDIADFLREKCPGMKIVHEGKAAIKDNALVAALLSLIKFTAHPGDMFAWRHVQMSPIAECLTQEGQTRENAPLALLSKIESQGFEALIRKFGAKLNAAHRLDAYGNECLADLLAAAIEFDATGNRDCNAFLRFIGDYETPQSPTVDAIRVMTIHQSKGLGFDVVILPELAGRSLDRASQPGIAIHRDRNINLPQWALHMPRRLIAENDPTLASEIKVADENACFDALCVLYVAMTRAKQALYMITSFPGPTSKALTAAVFLKMQLTGEANPEGGEKVTVAENALLKLYEHGNRQWHEKLPKADKKTLAARTGDLPADFATKPSTRVRLGMVEPSAQEPDVRSASSLFDEERRDVLDFGSAIHELFQKIEWIEEVDANKLIAEWQPSSPLSGTVKHDVCDQFLKAIASPEIRKVLSKPKQKVTLWREQAFEVILSSPQSGNSAGRLCLPAVAPAKVGESARRNAVPAYNDPIKTNSSELVGGIFDRVLICESPDGKPVSASILDYKSDRINNDEGLTRAVRRHRPQLQLYRRALSQILNLDPSKISLQLLFTRPGRVLELE